MIPCTYVFLSLYALINLNVINWGTREAASKAVGKVFEYLRTWKCSVSKRRKVRVSMSDRMGSYVYDVRLIKKKIRIVCIHFGSEKGYTFFTCTRIGI